MTNAPLAPQQPSSETPNPTSTAEPANGSLSELLTTPLTREAQALVPSNPNPPSTTPAVLQFAAPQLQSFETSRPRKPRNGKIAHLPNLERDMVNRMLANNLPYHKIVMALQDCGCQVTERNISNWKTRGGYKEWRAAQEHALELRTFQDNLTEFLRRHDAAELPEVGLQAAATTLSALLLRPDLMRELISEPEKYSKLIEIQCRLAREIQALQKDRNTAAKPLNTERLRRENEHDVENIREVMSSKIGKGPRDPNIPHRNFIPRELDPLLPSLTRSPADTLKMMENLGYLRPKTASSSPVTQPLPQTSQPAPNSSSPPTH